MSNALSFNNYWRWYNKQKSRNCFDEFNKVIQAPLSNFFDGHKACGACCKIKYLLSNQRAKQNVYVSSKKKYYRFKKKHTQLYDSLGYHFRTYIANKRLHEFHLPHGSQMKKVLNNLFACYAPKSGTYSTSMNLKTHIILYIAFHRCGYEYFLKNFKVALVSILVHCSLSR